MTRRLAAALVLAAHVCTAPAALAWGAAAHRFIMRRAIDLLPAEIKPFFIEHADELVLRVNDPDLWRAAGWPDDPNHFIDFGVPEYGPYPFTALPRSYDAAVEKFGADTVRKFGTLPWREAEEFGNLRRAFEGFTRTVQYAPSDTILFAAIAAHYIQDAYQPFHATVNFDGQATGQAGIHSRFETALFERYHDRLVVSPPATAPMRAPRDRAFDVLAASHQLVDPVLAADRQAVQGRDTYDEAYFEAFFAGVKGILQQQLSASIAETAALIAGAWEAAGKPVVRSRIVRPPQKVQ